MFELKKKIYNLVPEPVRGLICKVPYRFLAGSCYRASLGLCAKHDFACREDVLSYQAKKLSERLWFCVDHVPFYREYRCLMEKHSPFEALKGFPLISKETVQENFELFKPDCLGEITHHEASTGGSSGNQLTFLEDDVTYSSEMGFMHSQWKRVGYKPSCRKATFRGVQFKNLKSNVFWQPNAIHNEMQFSPFHMSEKNLSFYVDQLVKYKPLFLHGYPSAIDVLAEYIIRNGSCKILPEIKAVFLGSEGCSELQRDRIEEAFNARIYSWYGHSERVVLGGECEHSSSYHQFPAYGILEIINENGKECEPGEKGEIVGTGFMNRSMPLIRYRTDDYATREPFGCECGRNWDRFSNVTGRWSIEGAVIGKNGAKISAAALNMHGDMFKNVVRYQYYQNREGLIEIRLIVRPEFSDVDKQDILIEHDKKLHGEIDFVIKVVDGIPLTKSGKQKRIICELNM